jgi:hypothetical protein
VAISLINLGAVLFSATTRAVYERKLYQLQTGQKAASPSKYEPVDDDEEEPMDQSM